MKLMPLAALALCICAPVAGASGKGIGAMPAPGGVTAPGVTARYIAISPHNGDRLTVVARVDRDGGKLGRWWYLRGTWFVPAVAYDLSPGGLSADGRTLVLQRFSRAYPPRASRFAILDTQRAFRWAGPGRPPRSRRFFDYVDVRGDFSFDAISPDGSTLYLIQRYLPPSSGDAYIANYKVRALDVASGKLLPQPIVDPEEPDERMAGLPITRATSPDGRWAYTLYDGDGHEPFIHALDTVGRRAVCIDLPQLEGFRDKYMLRMRSERGGRQLTVMSGPPAPRKLPPIAQGRPVSSPQPQPLLSVNTTSFQVTAAAAPDDAAAEESGLLWPLLGLAGATLAFAITGLVLRRRRTADARVEPA